MDSRLYLENKFAKNTWKMVVAIALLLLGLVLILVGVSEKKSKDDAVMFIALDDVNGTYAYVDVSQVSEAAIEKGNETYYLAYDEDDYLYAISIPKRDYNKMSEQREAYDENRKPASTYRVYGIVEEPTQDFVDAMIDITEITEEDYYNYFGNRILNGNSVNDEMLGYVLLSAPFVLFGTLSLIGYFSVKKRIMKMIDNLDNKGLLEKAVMELQDVGGVKGCTFTSNFFISMSNKLIVPIEEIRWIYLRTNRVNFIPVNNYLVLNTDDISNFPISCGSKKKVNALAEEIARRNPNVMIGYTKENIERFKLKDFPTFDNSINID